MIERRGKEALKSAAAAAAAELDTAKKALATATAAGAASSKDLMSTKLAAAKAAQQAAAELNAAKANAGELAAVGSAERVSASAAEQKVAGLQSELASANGEIKALQKAAGGEKDPRSAMSRFNSIRNNRDNSVRFLTAYSRSRVCSGHSATVAEMRAKAKSSGEAAEQVCVMPRMPAMSHLVVGLGVSGKHAICLIVVWHLFAGTEGGGKLGRVHQGDAAAAAEGADGGKARRRCSSEASGGPAEATPGGGERRRAGRAKAFLPAARRRHDRLRNLHPNPKVPGG